jgi:hypothetical protein
MTNLPRVLLALFSLILAAACVAAIRAPDPQIAALAQQIHGEAALLFAKLNATDNSECDYANNQDAYDRLDALSGHLRSELATRKASGGLSRAVDALSRTIEHARTSHQLASNDIHDIYGACLAPVAIDLNAQAIRRAISAIAATQISD